MYLVRWVCAVYLLVGYELRSQEKIEIGAFVGGSGYLGDLNKSDWFSREPKAGVGGLVRYNVSDFMALRGSFLVGYLSGRDSHYQDRAFRNFTTKSPIAEISLQTELHFLPLVQPRLRHFFRATLSPFVFVGFGLVHSNPKADMENMLVLKPEFVRGVEIDRNASYRLVNGIVPFGMGIKYRPHIQWTVTLEAGFRYTFSDYLDGISYAANPAKTDRYQFWGLTLAYRFPKRVLGFRNRNPLRCAAALASHN